MVALLEIILLTNLFNTSFNGWFVKILSAECFPELQQIFDKEICPSLRDFKFSKAYTSDAGSEDHPDFFENDNDNVDELDDLDMNESIRWGWHNFTWTINKRWLCYGHGW